MIYFLVGCFSPLNFEIVYWHFGISVMFKPLTFCTLQFPEIIVIGESANKATYLRKPLWYNSGTFLDDSQETPYANN
jgi:hypothetical protein